MRVWNLYWCSLLSLVRCLRHPRISNDRLVDRGECLQLQTELYVNYSLAFESAVGERMYSAPFFVRIRAINDAFGTAG